MSNLEVEPTETRCGADGSPVPERLAPREVPLGGPRGLTVRRTLPHRTRSTVGAWCFLDDYGPTSLEGAGMHVPPHPHTGLQTVSWLLAGDVRHRDSLGSDVLVRPGELGLMTSGTGISHSEHTPAGATGTLRGVQLWVALPDGARDGPPAFAHHPDLPGGDEGGVVTTVFVGELAGACSPALVHTPLLGAQVDLAPGASTLLPLEEDFEHGVLVLEGALEVDGHGLDAGPLQHLPVGRRALRLRSEGGARVLLLGGEPFGQALVMWWNFLGRSHDEVVAAREDWAAGRRFGTVPGGEEPLPAPPLPNARLRPR